MEWFKLMASGIAAFLLLYFSGWLCAGCMPARQNVPAPLGFFLKLAAGFAAIPSLRAIWFTSGKTILTLGLTLFLVAIFFSRCPAGQRNFRLRKPKVEWRFLTAGVCLMPLFTLLQFLRNDYFNSLTISTSYVDFGIFSAMAQHLKTSGVENSTAWYELFPVAADGLTQPYHYLDLWLTGFVFDLTAAPPLAAYLYVLIPLLATVVFFANYAWVMALSDRTAEPQFGEKKPLNWSLAVIAMAGVFVTMQIPGVNWSNHLVFNVLLVPKIAPLWVLLPAALLARRQGWALAECLAVCGLALSHVLFLSVVMPVFGVLWWLDWRKERAPSSLLKLILIGSTTAGFFIFYSVTGAWETACAAVKKSDWQAWAYWFVRSSAAQATRFALFFLPACVGAFLLWAQKNERTYAARETLVLLTALVFWSILMSGLANNFSDHDQFGYLFQTAIASLFLMAVAAGLHFAKMKSKQGCIFSRAIWVLVWLQLAWGILVSAFLFREQKMIYSTDFLQVVKQQLASSQPIGAAISHPNSLDTHTANPSMCLFCNFLPMAGKGLWVNSLTVPEIPDELAFPERRDAVAKSPFFRFMQDLKRQGKFVDYATAQVQFVRAAQVDFLVVEAGAILPEGLQALTKHIFTDPVSNTRLVMLDRKKLKNRSQ